MTNNSSLFLVALSFDLSKQTQSIVNNMIISLFSIFNSVYPQNTPRPLLCKETRTLPNDKILVTGKYEAEFNGLDLASGD